jgi:hypothetical protein
VQQATVKILLSKFCDVSKVSRVQVASHFRFPLIDLHTRPIYVLFAVYWHSSVQYEYGDPLIFTFPCVKEKDHSAHTRHLKRALKITRMGMVQLQF